MTRRLTYAGTCMGHRPRPGGAPKGWLHNAMPCSCLLIPAFLTACHLTTIWAEDIILRHPPANAPHLPQVARLVALRKLGCSWGPNPPQRPSGIGAGSMLAAARADHPGARCQAGRRR